MKSKVVTNTVMLYLMSIAKLVFPLLTLPYLTRVLSSGGYGLITYVKSCMSYMQLIIDFGFILSSVKDIVKANGDQTIIGLIIGNTIMSKCILVTAAGIVMSAMVLSIPILQIDILFVGLSFIAVACSAFIVDFFFRGIEKMHYITVIYLVSKGISTFLTFVLVRDDKTMNWIPALDILSNLVSIFLSFCIVKHMAIPIRIGKISNCLRMIRESFTYFLSGVATTAFSALTTLLIGIFLTDLTQVAYWGLCLNIISAIQGLYSPVCNGIYPHMIQVRSLKFIRKVMLIVMPIVAAGCIFCFFVSETALSVIGGEQYIAASNLFCWMIPILLFSFPAQLYGWPTLGAIGKVKETTSSTVIAAIAQVLGLIILVLLGQFNLIALAILRCCTEALLMVIRMLTTYKNKSRFALG